MSGSPLVSPESASQREPTSRRLTRRTGLSLTLVGNLLVFVAFFSPWVDVYKLDDPSYVFPRQEYGPWTVLQRGQPASLIVVAWIFLLVILAMALSSLAAAFSRTANRRDRTATFAGVLALVSLCVVGMAVYGIHFGLSFSWPFLNSDVDYGSYLAGIGLVIVFVGLSILTSAKAPWE